MPKLIKKLNSLFDKLRFADSKHSPLFFFAIALAIIIPTIFAIYFAYFYEDDSFLSYNSINIELYDPDGELIFSDGASKSDIGSHSDLKMLYEIKTNSLSISESPAVEPTKEFRLVYSEGEEVSEYLCHFAESAPSSYIESNAGELYLVPQQTYALFLASPYSEKVYAISQPPALFTGDEQEVLPNEVSWSYKRAGEFAKSQNFKLSASSDSYHISGAINLAFDKPPTSCRAEVYDLSGKQLYEGTFDGLSSLSFAVGETVQVKLDATWKNTGISICHGKLKYDFKVTLATQASFGVSADSLTAGDILVLSVKNTQDINKIKYSADLSVKDSYILSEDYDLYNKEKLEAINALYDFEPSFLESGDTKLALIPLPLDLPTGIFAFTVSSGAASESFEIKITANPKKQYANIGKTEEELGTPPAISQLRELFATIKKPTQDIIFYSSQFVAPTDNGFSAGYLFGNTLISSDERLVFSALGNEYLASVTGGQSVKALNTGVVVGTGYSDTLGNYVAVEHGLGIRTWYCFLGDISVVRGDIVKKGDILGKSGNAPTLSGDGFLLLCSVQDIIVDPSFIFEKTLLEN